MVISPVDVYERPLCRNSVDTRSHLVYLPIMPSQLICVIAEWEFGSSPLILAHLKSSLPKGNRDWYWYGKTWWLECLQPSPLQYLFRPRKCVRDAIRHWRKLKLNHSSLSPVCWSYFRAFTSSFRTSLWLADSAVDGIRFVYFYTQWPFG